MSGTRQPVRAALYPRHPEVASDEALPGALARSALRRRGRRSPGSLRAMIFTMSPARIIELPDDLEAFAEEQVRAGKNASVADVVYDALEDKMRAALREALEDGIAELDAGLGVETSVEELMAEARAEAGLTL